MGAGYFIIAILGCGDGSSACTPVVTMPTRYATESECVSATGAALIERSDLDFPTLVARCEAGPALNIAAAKSARRAPELALRN